MKRSWSTILLVIGLVGLLTLLGALQYRWLSQISEAEGEKARQRVQEQADRFAMDFNREIQNAYFNFQTDAETWKAKDWTAFNERFDFWKEKAAYSDLIKQIFFFEAMPEAQLMTYVTDTRSFATTQTTPELAGLMTAVLDHKTFKPVYADSYTLILPIHDVEPKVEHLRIRLRSPAVPDETMLRKMPPKYGYVVIRLDPATIKDKILPDLVAKYFGDGEFRSAVVDRDGQAIFQSVTGETSDASAPLLDLSPGKFIFYTGKDLMNSVEGEKRQDVIINSRVESHTFSSVQSESEEPGIANIEVKRDSKPQMSFFTSATIGGSSNTPWMLQVQHSSGSLDAHIANTLRRNLAIGFGLLLLLAAAVAAILISAQRAKLFAQRQVDFVSSVSHEFRTPLAVIYSAGENLADGVTKEQTQISQYGQLIKGEGRKLTSMVEQILDFAGAASGRKKYNFSDTRIVDVVNDALSECGPLIAENKIAFETRIADGLPNINADRAALSQAIQNLIVNAVKYSGDQTRLSLTAENGDGYIKISVEDRGIGIAKSDVRQIFEPFFRSKDVVDAQIHGNGLGLSLVKQITEGHGGKVTVESEIGKGSKFTIELPI